MIILFLSRIHTKLSKSNMKQLLTVFFSTMRLLVLLVHLGGGAEGLRQKRQVPFGGFPGKDSFLFQLNDLTPVSASQITAARCEALVGQEAPTGCTYLPLLVDATGAPLSCRLECGTLTSAPFFPPPGFGQFGPQIIPDYLLTNDFTITDFSNLESSNAFIGDSYFLITPAATATTPLPTAGSASTSVSTTPLNPTTVAPTTPSDTVVSTRATTTAVTADPITILDAMIEECNNAGLTPGNGCSFTGVASRTPALTCKETCVSSPAIEPPCDPAAGSHAEQCLCYRGPPEPGCSYKFSGNPYPSLTCPQSCPTSFWG